jgi:hypothetical protein
MALAVGTGGGCHEPRANLMNDQFTISIGFGVQMREKLSERKARERGRAQRRDTETGVYASEIKTDRQRRQRL